MFRNAMGWLGDGWHQISRKKCCKGVVFNVISATTRWLGIKFPEKKRYVTLEWPIADWIGHYGMSKGGLGMGRRGG